MSPSLGFDTSNYTTSAAVFDGREGENLGQLLEVPGGSLGLRQSEALFQHIRALPKLTSALRQRGLLHAVRCVAASTRPRAVEGSYMPCFLAGEAVGRAAADVLDVPFLAVSHQQGHLAAAAWSAGRTELLDREFLAWHLSGGTTELLHVTPEGKNVCARRIGGTGDISAGQLIDRTGVLLGLPFPAGRALDELSLSCTDAPEPFRVRLDGMDFSLSGVENKVRELWSRGEKREQVAAFALDTAVGAVYRATQAARTLYPGLPVLFSGGVASNSRLRARMAPVEGTFFAQPRFSADNAMGAAILAYRCGEECLI